jgi:hypothetical protein
MTKVSDHRTRARGTRERWRGRGRGRGRIAGASAPRSGATPERAMGEERSEPGVIQSTPVIALTPAPE